MSYYYTYTLTHPGLGRSRVLRAASRAELQQQAEAQLRIWNDLYARQREASARRQAKANKAAHLQDAQNEAEARTREAQEVLSSIKATLKSGIVRQLSYSWDSKKNHLPYPVPQPQVVYHQFPPQPQPDDPAYSPHFGLLDKVVGPLREKKVAGAQKLYDDALAAWQSTCASIGHNNDILEADYLARIEDWKTKKHAFEKAQADANAAVDLKTRRYMAGSATEVIEYNSRILEQSEYPPFFEKSFDLDYNSVKRVLLVNYDLPSFDDFPKLDSVKYVKSKDTFSESYLSNREAADLYASFAYQVCLRTIRELFSADAANALAGVAFNGFVSATNPATGNVESTCILAVTTTPSAFSSLNLAKVDPEECFRGLGGVCSTPLEKYRAVTPASAESLAPSQAAAAWIDLLKARISGEGGTASMQVKELQQIVGAISGKRASLGESRSLVAQLGEAGFAIEPDASVMAQSYRVSDAVSIFVPDATVDLRASEAYCGAAGILAMCGLVVAADGKLETGEVDRARECVEQAFKFSPSDHRRFEALLKALFVNSDWVWRSLPKMVSQLRAELREWAAEVAVYVALRSGTIDPSERAVLDRMFPAIGLAKETQDRIIAKYTAISQEVTVLQADDQPVGEKIQQGRVGLVLDMSRVAAIAQETKEVVARLSDIMDDKEAKLTEQPAPLPTPSAQAPADSELNASYQPLYRELITRPQWARSEFDGLASKFNLMPTAAIDVINAWADDALGDFLIEGNDPVIIHVELVPSTV
jgi:tellurite resistance protein